MKTGFPRVGDKLQIEVKSVRWVLTHVPARPAAPKPVLHYWPTTSDGVTRARNAVALRCHLWVSRQATVLLM